MSIPRKAVRSIFWIPLTVLVLIFAYVLIKRQHVRRVTSPTPPRWPASQVDLTDYEPYAAETVRPQTISRPHLRTRPPSAFIKGTTDTDILKEYRAHLEGIAARDPEQQVLGYVFLWSGITEDEFDRIQSAYDLKGGDSTNIEVSVEDLPVSRSADGVGEALARHGMINAFALWGTTGKFLSAWQAEPKTIRGIAILGIPNKYGLTREGEPYPWYPIAPNAPLCAGVQVGWGW